MRLFETLPADVIRFIARLANLRVILIEGEPTDEEKNAVTAVVQDVRDQDGNPDLSRPHLSTYHLIAAYSKETGALEYKIGFCKKSKSSVKYVTHTLAEKSPLLRYVREDLTHRGYSKLFPFNHSQVRLLRLMEREIKAAGGLTRHRLRDHARFAWVCRNFNHAVNISSPYGSILQELFKDLCDHESFHEIKEARALLEHFPQLLLSQFKGDIVGSAPELTFHDFTLIQKAYALGNWFFYEMALEVIEQSKLLSEENKAFYKEDIVGQIVPLMTQEQKENYKTYLSNQLADLGKDDPRKELLKEKIAAVDNSKSLKWALNNLLNKGVRIINADTMKKHPIEAWRLIVEIIERNGYHLIIEEKAGEVVSCTLGYRDPETKKYIPHEILKTDPLFAIAHELHLRRQNATDADGNRHTHCFTRDNRDLVLFKAVLDQLQVPTQFCQTATLLNLTGSLAAQHYNWLVERHRNHLHSSIYSECRLFSGTLLQLWMSANMPWTDDEEEMRAFVLGEKCGVVELNYLGEHILPVSSFWGDNFSAARRGTWHDVNGRRGGWRPRPECGCFIEIYLECRTSKADRFYRCLTRQPEPKSQSSCSLM